MNELEGQQLSPATDAPTRRRWLVAGACLLLVLAAVEFVVRGPLHWATNRWDFAVYYTSSRAWLQGQNPYQRSSQEDVWKRAGGDARLLDPLFGSPNESKSPEQVRWLPVVHFPPALSVMAPLAALSAPVAQHAFTALIIALSIGSALALISMLEMTPLSVASALVLAAMLAGEPLHTAVASGQPTGIVVGLIILALWCAHNERDTAAGVLLGVAAALKPQLAGPFALYFMWQGRPKVWMSAGATLAVLTSIALVPLEARYVRWLPAWRAELQSAHAAGGMNDGSLAGDGRFQMLNLQVLAQCLSDDVMLCAGAGLGVTACLTLVYMVLHRRARLHGDATQVLPLSVVAILTLLPVYHRFYDATLLVIPIAWAIREFNGRNALAARVVLATSLIFLAPCDVVNHIARHLHLSEQTTNGFWWNFLAVPVRVWALLTMLAALLAVIARLGGIGAQGSRRSVFIPIGRQRASRTATLPTDDRAVA